LNLSSQDSLEPQSKDLVTIQGQARRCQRHPSGKASL